MQNSFGVEGPSMRKTIPVRRTGILAPDTTRSVVRSSVYESPNRQTMYVNNANRVFPVRLMNNNAPIVGNQQTIYYRRQVVLPAPVFELGAMKELQR